jgi:hypothetical protein
LSRRIHSAVPIVDGYTDSVAFAHDWVANPRTTYVASPWPGASQKVQATRSEKSSACNSTVTRVRTPLLLPSWNVAVTIAFVPAPAPVCCSTTPAGVPAGR